MSEVVLDTHVLYWLWAGATDKVTDLARTTVENADRLTVAAITWHELALLFERGRIESLNGDVGGALSAMAERVTTAPLSWQIAQRAAELERNSAFPRDPADRLIYATASSRNAQLVTADGLLRRFSAEICVW